MDTSGGRWFLRDDFAFWDTIDVPPEQVPQNVPIIKNSNVKGNTLHGTIYGESMEIKTNWREQADPQVLSLLLHTTLIDKDHLRRSPDERFKWTAVLCGEGYYALTATPINSTIDGDMKKTSNCGQ